MKFLLILLVSVTSTSCASFYEFHEKYKNDPRLWEISRQQFLLNPRTEVCTYGVAGKVCVK